MSKFGGSKYRHIVGTLQKKELWYPDLKPTSGGGEATTIAASSLWISVAWASVGSVALLAMDQPGKRKTIDLPMIFAHSVEIADMAFSPFRDDLLATSADDSSVKLWKIPANNTANINTAELVLSGHKKRPDSIKFNPVANNVLASGSSDKSLRIWDIGASKEVLCMDAAHTDVIHSIDWNFTGSLICTISKDKKIRIIDPRANSVVQTGEAHQGVKASRVAWLGEYDKIASTGFNKMRERQFGLWDPKDFSKPLNMPSLDSSTGVVDLFYDNDSRMLILAGKGDGNIRMFEMNDNAPLYTELSNVQSDVAQKCVTTIPKRAVDLMNTEIIRAMKLTANAVAPVSYSVPRKTKSEFQEDLYPPTASGEPVLNAEKWFAGENGTPKKIQLKPTSNPHKFWDEEANKSSESKQEVKSTPQQTTSTTSSTPVQQQQQTSTSSAPSQTSQVKEQEKTRPVSGSGTSSTAYVPKVVKVVRSSKYRHIATKGTKTEDCYTNMRVSTGASNKVICANRTFFCVPWQGAGGVVGVFPLNKTGRTPDKVPLVECGSPCLDFDWNPFNDHILATVNEMAHLQIWRIPPGGLTQLLNTPEIVLKGHQRRVTTVDFHPNVSNLVITSSADSTLRIWDLDKSEEAYKMEATAEGVQSVTWNWNGSLCATSSKEKELKIFDSRAKSVVQKCIAHDGAKGFKAAWLGNSEKIATVGFGKNSERQVGLFDTRKFDGPIHSVHIDNGSGMISPYYDPDTGVLFLSGKGDGNIKMYEIDEDQICYLTEYGTSTPAAGVAMLPKISCNVKECEIDRFLKLSSDYVEPLSMKVPRTKMEYFQDDIYPPTKKIEPTLSADEWRSGKNLDPEMMDLQPEGMKRLSDAPVEQKTKKYDFNANQPEELTKDKVYDKWHSQMNSLKEKESSVLKQDLMEGTDDSEWD